MGLMMAAVPRELEDVERPVVVRARSRGICRNVTFPTIVGHEPAGVGADVEPGIRPFKPGDGVVRRPSGFRAHGRRSAIRFLERGVIDREKIISRRFALKDIHQAIGAMARPDRNKGMVNP